MIKVCFLLGGFQGNGGIGRVTSILANHLVNEKEFEIHTISYIQDERKLLYSLDPKVHQHALYNSQYSMTKAILCNHVIKKVKNILNQENINIVVACGALFYPLGILACKKTNAKCICWEHTNPQISSDYKFQNFCRKFAVKYSDKLVVLTKSAENFYYSNYPIKSGKIEQIYNPINNDVIKSNGYRKDSKKIISVGRLTYPKNFERLITIASNILPKYPGWSWDIYGDGELKEKLSKMIIDNNLERKVILKGQVSDIYKKYPEYSFLVMTSRYEGFPMSLIEGAANRLPLVCFDVPTGPDEIIADGINGYLVNKDCDDEMIQKIEYLMDNETERVRMSEEVFKLTRSFSIERVIEEWKILFAELK